MAGNLHQKHSELDVTVIELVSWEYSIFSWGTKTSRYCEWRKVIPFAKNPSWVICGHKDKCLYGCFLMVDQHFWTTFSVRTIKHVRGSSGHMVRSAKSCWGDGESYPKKSLKPLVKNGETSRNTMQQDATRNDPRMYHHTQVLKSNVATITPGNILSSWSADSFTSTPEVLQWFIETWNVGTLSCHLMSLETCSSPWQNGSHWFPSVGNLLQAETVFICLCFVKQFFGVPSFWPYGGDEWYLDCLIAKKIISSDNQTSDFGIWGANLLLTHSGDVISLSGVEAGTTFIFNDIGLGLEPNFSWDFEAKPGCGVASKFDISSDALLRRFTSTNSTGQVEVQCRVFNLKGLVTWLQKIDAVNM